MFIIYFFELIWFWIFYRYWKAVFTRGTATLKLNGWHGTRENVFSYRFFANTTLVLCAWKLCMLSSASITFEAMVPNVGSTALWGPVRCLFVGAGTLQHWTLVHCTGGPWNSAPVESVPAPLGAGTLCTGGRWYTAPMGVVLVTNGCHTREGASVDADRTHRL